MSKSESTAPPLDPLTEADHAVDHAAQCIAGMLKREPASVSRLTRLHLALLVVTDRADSLARVRGAPSTATARESEAEPSTYRPPLDVGRPRRRSRSSRYVP